MVNARTATARDFDKAAQRNADAFWLWLVVGGVVWFLVSWGWAIIPAAVAVYCAFNSMYSTRAAQALRSGSYRIPNPNNAAPDGDASNLAD